VTSSTDDRILTLKITRITGHVFAANGAHEVKIASRLHIYSGIKGLVVVRLMGALSYLPAQETGAVPPVQPAWKICLQTVRQGGSGRACYNPFNHYIMVELRKVFGFWAISGLQ